MKLQAIKIEKSYQSRKVVDRVDLELKQGEIVGLLGPNGAGKTTCFYMIVGLIKSDSGKIMIDTIEVSKDKIFDKLEIMSVANVFGEAMKRIIDGTSLSSMFQEAKG